MQQTTIRHHVYQIPNARHNWRDPDQIAAENTKSQTRYIDPDGEHETWVRDLSALEAYQEVFGEALEQYNAQQKRKDRRMTMESYMQSVEQDTRGRKNKAIAANNERTGRTDKTQGKRPTIEVVVSVGNMTPARADKGYILRDKDGRRIMPQRIPEAINKQIQQAYWATFEERNPNLYIVRVDYHADECFWDKVSGQWEKGIEHSHGEIIPFADGYSRGLSLQCSIGKALAQMGFKDTRDVDGKWRTAYELWSEREREYIETVLVPQYLPGYEIDHPYHDRHVQGRNTDEYQELQDLQIEIERAKQIKSALFKQRCDALTDRTRAYELRDTALEAASTAIAAQDKAQGEAEAEKRVLAALKKTGTDTAAQNLKLYHKKRVLEREVADLQAQADSYPDNMGTALAEVDEAKMEYHKAIAADEGGPLIKFLRTINITATEDDGSTTTQSIYDLWREFQRRQEKELQRRAERAQREAEKIQRRLPSLQSPTVQREDYGQDF